VLIISRVLDLMAQKKMALQKNVHENSGTLFEIET
jgi:hypothetical protein